MNEDENGKAHAKFCSPQSPVHGNKSGKAEEKIKFEERQQSLALGQQDGDRARRTQLSRPGIFRLRRGARLLLLQLAGMITDPTSLRGSWRQQGQRAEPKIPGVEKSALLFEKFGLLGNGGESLAMNQCAAR